MNYSERAAGNKRQNTMKAADLITLANSKGYSTSRTKPNHYQTHQTVDGKHVTVDFFGKWSEFVKYVKSL